MHAFSYGYKVVYRLGAPGSSVTGFNAWTTAAKNAADRYGLTAGEESQLASEGFLYLRESGPHSTKLSTTCVTLFQHA